MANKQTSEYMRVGSNLEARQDGEYVHFRARLDGTRAPSKSGKTDILSQTPAGWVGLDDVVPGLRANISVGFKAGSK